MNTKTSIFIIIKSNECLLSYSRMPSAILSNAFCHTRECLLPYSRMLSAILSNAFCHTRECLLSYSRMPSVILANAFCHTRECLLSYSRMRVTMPQSEAIQNRYPQYAINYRVRWLRKFNVKYWLAVPLDLQVLKLPNFLIVYIYQDH
jgi:hypothetical protein